MAEGKFNLKNSAVKRILQEVKEMQSNPSDDFMSLPLEEDMFEWQFAIRGPRDTEFEGGIYHGRIQLPAEYPFKPPSFMLLTPNGRFETQTKICLSISNHHPEHWQPSWGVRTALLALIAFMPTNPNGALGSLDFKKEDRRALAIKSQVAPRVGSPERQKLIDEIHAYMLRKAPTVPQLSPSQSFKEQLANGVDEARVTHQNADSRAGEEGPPPNATVVDRIVEEQHEVHVNNNTSSDAVRASGQVPATGPADQLLQKPQTRVQRPADDRLYTWAIIGLTIAVLVLLLKKFLKSSGYGAVFTDGS